MPAVDLVLIGTTHPRDYDLSQLSIPVTKVYSTRDGVAPYDEMLRNKELLPHKTSWVPIEGGNHVQFGYYRHQVGDGRATIPREGQQRALEAALLSAMGEIK